MKNVEDENVKDAEAENIRRADVSHATFALLWSLWRKETVEILPWNDSRSLSWIGDIVKVEDDAEQEKADEETVFEFFQMEEDDIDLLEPS